MNPKAVLKLSQFVIFVERYCWRFLPHLQKYMIFGVLRRQSYLAVFNTTISKINPIITKMLQSTPC
jgi:hypothetical protein